MLPFRRCVGGTEIAESDGMHRFSPIKSPLGAGSNCSVIEIEGFTTPGTTPAAVL